MVSPARRNPPAAQNEPGELQLPEADPTMQILHPFTGSVQQYPSPNHIVWAINDSHVV